jgi:membrane protein
VRGVVSRFWNEDVLLWCGAIAFKAIVTILPLTLLLFGIFGLFLREGRIIEGLSRVVDAALPAGQAGRIIEVMESFAQVSDTVTLVGSLALLVAAISFFTTLRVVLENVFHKTHVKRSTIAGYVSDLQMAVVCGALFLGTLTVTNFRRIGFSIDLERVPPWLHEIWLHVQGWTGLALPLLLSSALFLLLYRFVPRPSPKLGSCLAGAAFAGISWELAKHGFTLFATHSTMFTRLRDVGEQADLNALGELFVLAVLLVFWVYYSALILIVGGMITALRDERLRSRDKVRSKRSE